MVNPKQKLIITNDNTNEYTNPNSDRNTETNLRSPRPVLPLLIINCNGQSAGGESWVAWDGNYEAMKHNSLPQKPTLLFHNFIQNLWKWWKTNSHLPRVPHLVWLIKGCTTSHPSSMHLAICVRLFFCKCQGRTRLQRGLIQGHVSISFFIAKNPNQDQVTNNSYPRTWGWGNTGIM